MVLNGYIYRIERIKWLNFLSINLSLYTPSRFNMEAETKIASRYIQDVKSSRGRRHSRRFTHHWSDD